jgi:hypothetical protein
VYDGPVPIHLPAALVLMLGTGDVAKATINVTAADLQELFDAVTEARFSELPAKLELAPNADGTFNMWITRVLGVFRAKTEVKALPSFNLGKNVAFGTLGTVGTSGTL